MREPAYNINLNTLNWEAMQSLHYHDNGCVGSKKYLGLAFFWEHESKFRYLLRELNLTQRKRLHTKILNAGIKAVYSGKSKMGNGEWSKYYHFKSKDIDPICEEFFTPALTAKIRSKFI